MKPTKEKKWVKIKFIVPSGTSDYLSYILDELGALGSIIDNNTSNNLTILTTFFNFKQHPFLLIEKIKKKIKKAFPFFPKLKGYRLSWEIIEEEDWAYSWKKYFTYHKITKKIAIAPPWEKKRNDVPIFIYIEPAMAFGTGLHPTTKLCLMMLEKYITQKEIKDLLDVGTGSGILSIASIFLGAKNVLGIDIDKDAIKSARKNRRLNRLKKKPIFSFKPLSKIKKKFDIVVANLTRDIIVENHHYLNERIVTHGKLIISGILIEQKKEIKALMQKNGLKLIDEKENEDWLCLVMEK